MTNNCTMDEKLYDKWKIEKQNYTMDEDYGIKVIKMDEKLRKNS
jgi:hypothetical protein